MGGRRDASPAAHQRRPEFGAAGPGVVQLEAELADEAGPDRGAGDAGHRDLAVCRVRERGRVQWLGRQGFEQVARAWAGHQDRAELRGPVEQVHVQAQPVVSTRAGGRPCVRRRRTSR